VVDVYAATADQRAIEAQLHAGDPMKPEVRALLEERARAAGDRVTVAAVAAGAAVTVALLLVFAFAPPVVAQADAIARAVEQGHGDNPAARADLVAGDELGQAAAALNAALDRAQAQAAAERDRVHLAALALLTETGGQAGGPDTTDVLTA